MRKADPVADRGGLGDAASDVTDRQATKQGVVVVEDEEGVALILAQLALILAQPAAESGSRQLIAGPLRFPANKVLTAQRTQLCPGRIVGHGRMAQIDIGAADFGLRVNTR